jgi:dual specificity phosphatase 12
MFSLFLDGTVKLFTVCSLCLPGDAYTRGEKIDSSSYAADPGNVTNEQNSQDLGEQQAVSNQLSKVYRCKKCRRVVASEENVITHIPGAGVTSFKWRKRGVQGSGKDELTQPECTSIFVQPMQWMTPGTLSSGECLLQR